MLTRSKNNCFEVLLVFHFSEHTNHFAESIVTYFDTALSTMLLYAVERSQYKEV